MAAKGIDNLVFENSGQPSALVGFSAEFGTLNGSQQGFLDHIFGKLWVFEAGQGEPVKEIAMRQQPVMAIIRSELCAIHGMHGSDEVWGHPPGPRPPFLLVIGLLAQPVLGIYNPLAFSIHVLENAFMVGNEFLTRNQVIGIAIHRIHHFDVA